MNKEKMIINLFNIANFKVDGGAMFGVVPKALWSRVYSSDENNLIDLTLRSMVVETDGHVILIDTGWGDKQNEKFFLLKTLGILGTYLRSSASQKKSMRFFLAQQAGPEGDQTPREQEHNQNQNNRVNHGLIFPGHAQELRD